MSLLDVPAVLWHSLLFNWVSFPELIRFDCAVSSGKEDDNLLHTVYSGCNFRFSGNEKLLSLHLDKLLQWMKSRKVYFASLAVKYNATAPQWGQILKWTGNTIRNLRMSDPDVECVSLSCKNLEQLYLEFPTTNAEHLQAILCCNPSTLKTLHLEELDITNDINLDIPVLQITELKFTSCVSAIMMPIIGKCPHLWSLYVGDYNIKLNFATCVATHCKQLQVLKIKGANVFDTGALLVIAQGCPKIALLSITDCASQRFEGVREMVCALPAIRSLALKSKSGFAADFVDLKRIRSKSLLAVEIGGFTFPKLSFHKFTVRCPKLETVIHYHRWCTQHVQVLL